MAGLVCLVVAVGVFVMPWLVMIVALWADARAEERRKANMNITRVGETCRIYYAAITTKYGDIRAHKHGAVRIGDVTLPEQRRIVYEHVLAMIDRIDPLVEAGRRDKAMRWYGFIQGVLWVMGMYSIDELREHSRTAEDRAGWRSDAA